MRGVLRRRECAELFLMEFSQPAPEDRLHLGAVTGQTQQSKGTNGLWESERHH